MELVARQGKTTESFDGRKKSTRGHGQKKQQGSLFTTNRQDHRALDGRINPALLVRAHMAWIDRRSSKPSWNRVHGPLGAVILEGRCDT